MYNILSVDGRGVTQALIATKIIQIIDDKLKQCTGEGVIKHFDHIASSSTAAFPAALIAHAYTPQKTYETVKNSFHAIFKPVDTSCDSLQCWFTNCIEYIYPNSDKTKLYTLDNLNDLLKNFRNVHLGESKIPLLLLSAKNSQKLETCYFSSKYDKDALLSDAVKSCIADKLHFPPYSLEGQGYFDHSFISKSSLGSTLSYITKDLNLTDSSLLVVNIGFDNLNTTDYLQTETTQNKVSSSDHLEINLSSSEDVNINAGRFLKGNFWNIVITQGQGILAEVHKFDKILDDDKIENIIKGSKICNNTTDECISFEEGIDQLINDGLINNSSLANELAALTNESDTCI